MPSHRTDVEDLGLDRHQGGRPLDDAGAVRGVHLVPGERHAVRRGALRHRGDRAGGLVRDRQRHPAGQSGTTFTYRSADPVATYLTTLAVGKYQKLTVKGPHGIPLTYWYRKGTDDKLLPYLKKSPQYIAWLEKRFGPYPFPSGGVVVVDSASGMETQQMITMGAQDRETPRPAGTAGASTCCTSTPTSGSATPSRRRPGPTCGSTRASPPTPRTSTRRRRCKLSDGRAWTGTPARPTPSLRKKLGPPGKPDPKNFAEGNVYLCPAAMLREIHNLIGDKTFFALATRLGAAAEATPTRTGRRSSRSSTSRPAGTSPS